MSDKQIHVLKSYYRCPAEYDVFAAPRITTAPTGFFKFGKDTVCYGRNVSGFSEPMVDANLHDVMNSVVRDGPNVLLPFDAGEVIENLRRERYISSEKSAMLANTTQKIYYTLRPLMPVGFRKHLQKLYLNRWRRIAFPRWPVDRTVEGMFEQLVHLSIGPGSERMPFVWFWPGGASGCLMMTHDIETTYGRDLSLELADLDASFGIKSAFQVVPLDRYTVSEAFLESLRTHGREINLHGLRHDGQLFRDRAKFEKDVKEINRYAKEYGAAGFRSPVLYRNLDWYDDFDVSYDMSVPNVAHLDPQRGGCCTVMPYFIGHILELPLTTTQDYSLFHVLGNSSIDLWKVQIAMILEKHGLISFNIHPDYIMAEPYRSIYRQLLDHLRRICAERNIWIALPGEVDQWWRQRQEMHVVQDGNAFRIVGPHAERAVLAYARRENGSVTYELSHQSGKSVSASSKKHIYN
jgi:hypothetical protein